jgi:hypothetical protein
MSTMTRPMWAAVLARFVSPMEPERAAKAIAAMVPALTYPDAAFTLDSAREVCATGRVMGDGVYGPMSRVPTFGELDLALGKWWRHQREMQAVRALPVAREALPAPEGYVPEPRVTPEACEHVAGLVKAFVSERAFNQAAGTAGKPSVTAHHLSDGQLVEVYTRLAAEGAPGARVRLETLRRSMGDVA